MAEISSDQNETMVVFLMPKFMKTDPSRDPLVGIRLHLTDGSVHSFIQRDDTGDQKGWTGFDPTRLFVVPRIVIGSQNSKAVFISAEIVRVDFLNDSFQGKNFPGGFLDVLELSEEEFCQYAHFDQPALLSKREQRSPVGDLLVSFVRLHMRGVRPLFAMIQVPVKLPAESQSFMQFMLSKAVVRMRLRGGGIGVLNLANLAGYTVYSGLAPIPVDALLAEPTQAYAHETLES
jgi:hypothetical protein